MGTLKDIVCKNLISLRKEHNLTQVDLSKKINYSDKAISRWEKGEVTPSLEILESLAEIYKVAPSYFFEEHLDEESRRLAMKEKNLYTVIILSLSLVVWIIASFTFILTHGITDVYHFEIFMWAIPATTLVVKLCSKYLLSNRYYILTSSLFFWSFIIVIYIQWLELNFWLLFLLGIPVQLTIVLMDYVRKLRVKTPKKLKKGK